MSYGIEGNKIVIVWNNKYEKKKNIGQTRTPTLKRSKPRDKDSGVYKNRREKLYDKI